MWVGNVLNAILGFCQSRVEIGEVSTQLVALRKCCKPLTLHTSSPELCRLSEGANRVSNRPDYPPMCSSLYYQDLELNLRSDLDGWSGEMFHLITTARSQLVLWWNLSFGDDAPSGTGKDFKWTGFIGFTSPTCLTFILTFKEMHTRDVLSLVEGDCPKVTSGLYILQFISFRLVSKEQICILRRWASYLIISWPLVIFFPQMSLGSSVLYKHNLIEFAQSQPHHYSSCRFLWCCCCCLPKRERHWEMATGQRRRGRKMWPMAGLYPLWTCCESHNLHTDTEVDGVRNSRQDVAANFKCIME